MAAGGWLDLPSTQNPTSRFRPGLGYSFVMTTIIRWNMHFTPGLQLHTSEEAEIIGIDDAEMGVFVYDCVGIELDHLKFH